MAKQRLIVWFSIGSITVFVVIVSILMLFLAKPWFHLYYRDWIIWYQLALNICMSLCMLLQIFYLKQHWHDFRRSSTDHLHIPDAFKTMTFFLLVVVIGGNVFFAGFEWFYWNCPLIIDMDGFGRYLDILYVLFVCVFLLFTLFYCYQRSVLTPQPDDDDDLFSEITRTITTAVLVLMETKMISEKVYLGYRTYYFGDTGNTTVPVLIHNYTAHCTQKYAHNWPYFYETVLAPGLFLIEADFMPILIAIHLIVTNNSQSNYYTPTSLRLKFHKGWLLPSPLRALMSVLAPLAIVSTMLARLHFGQATDSAHLNPIQVDIVCAVAGLLWLIHHFTLFLAHIKGNLIDSNPASWNTELAAHARLEMLILGLCLCAQLIFKISHFIYRPDFYVHWTADLIEILSYTFEFLNLKLLVQLEDRELLQDGFGNFSIGPLFVLSATLFNFANVFDVFGETTLIKQNIHDGDKIHDTKALLQILTEPIYFTVTMYYFTAGICWFQLVHRYYANGAYAIGRNPDQHEEEGHPEEGENMGDQQQLIEDNS